MHTGLKWIERALLATSAALAIWCGTVLMEARHVNNLPIPPADPRAAVVSAANVVEPGDWVARFEAPSVGLSATVLEGTGDSVLGLAAGHIEDTAFPGAPGNVGIAGHRDTTFRAVRNLKIGDVLRLTTRDRTFDYRISSMFIVNPDEVWVLDPSDHQMLTLVTCYPFAFIGHAPQRYIVKADLVSP